MKNKKTYMAILLGLLVGAGSTVCADSIIFSASDDSFVVGSNTGLNRGTLTSANLRVDNTTWGHNYGLYKFDLSGLPALGAGESFQIDAVRMRFYTGLSNFGAGDSFVPVGIYSNQADWDESTVTYANAPAYAAGATEILDHFGLPGTPTPFTSPDTISAGGWLEYVGAGTKALVQDWVDGTTSNYGVSIMGTEFFGVNTDKQFLLQTKENPATGVQPRLIVDYTIIPEPATLGLVGFSALAMLIVRRKFSM